MMILLFVCVAIFSAIVSHVLTIHFSPSKTWLPAALEDDHLIIRYLYNGHVYAYIVMFNRRLSAKAYDVRNSEDSTMHFHPGVIPKIKASALGMSHFIVHAPGKTPSDVEDLASL